MICSSDILALARGQEQADFKTQRSSTLPDQLSLPPLLHPWGCSPPPYDLVLLCEFGEGGEPRLLFVAPPTSKPHPHLDLVRSLLTVGYQATGSRASSGRGFLEDSWVLLGDSFKGVFVYARYVLLLDLHACGEVRPVAMALVSHDSVKLLQGLEELNEAFSKAACSLQTGHTHTHTLPYTHTPQPLVERCDWFFYQQTLELLCAIQQRFHGDASLLAHRRDSAHLLTRLSAANVLWVALSPSNPLHGDLSPSNPLHGDLYVSCIQAVPIKLVAEGQSHDAPDVPAVSMETSSHSSGDSIEVLATERSFRGQDAAQVVAMETSWGRGAWRGPGRGAWRTDSQDSSIEVLSRDSFLPDDLRPSDSLLQGLMGTVVKEEEEGQGDVGTVVQEEEDDGGSVVHEIAELQEDAHLQGIMGKAVRDDAHLQGIMGKAVHDNAHLQGIMGKAVHDDVHLQGIMGKAVQDDAHLQGIMGSAVQDDAHLQGIMGTEVKESQFSICSPTTTPYLHDNLFQLFPLCPIGREDNSDCGSTSSSDSSHSSCVAWQCGEAALRLVRCWEPTRHAVFSLLIGRLLVVLGSKKKRVTELVHALELFLPHTHTHAHAHTHRVLPWCCRPIQITDLLEYSIIGLNRICSSAPRMPFCLERYARYISVLDADHMTLRCPAYRGTLIGRLTQPQSQLREGGTYALLVQSALTRLAAQAFHHVFSGQQGALLLGAADDDVRILNYLCDLITLRLTHHAPSTVLRFCYQPCTLFR